MILAGIDIGTNTLRLLIAETDHDAFREIYSDRKVVRLGQGLDHTATLAPDAIMRCLQALRDFSENIRRHHAMHVAVVGTSALRNAANARACIDQVKRETGLDLVVVSGEEEARLTLLGVMQSLKGRGVDRQLDAALIIDIGGGSTEIIITRPARRPTVASLPLGAVYFTERFLHSDPPSKLELAGLRTAIRTILTAPGTELRPEPSGVAVGTAGTVTTLAAIYQKLDRYDPARINGTILSRAFIDDIVATLGRLTLEERKTIRGLERGREDIILAGAVITQEIMEHFGYRSILVSDGGLREGIVLDLFNQLGI